MKKRTVLTIALCFLMVFTCLGFCSSNKGLYLSAITEALGLERSAFSLGDTFRFLSSTIVNLFFGRLIYKFGEKKLILAGFLALMGSCTLYATSRQLWGFYLGSCLLGLGLAWTTTTMVGWVVGKRCKKNKGTVMGGILAANGLGGALAAQLVTPLIYQEGNPFGYRSAYWMITGILLGVALLLLLFFKEQKEKAPPAAKQKSRAKLPWYFYPAAICIFLTGLILQGIIGIAAAHMRDIGLESAFIATVLSVHSLALTASKFLTGFLCDRWGIRKTVLLCDLAAVTTLISLFFIRANTPALGMIYAIASAMALPLETVMLPILAGEFFSEAAYSRGLALFVSTCTAGFALGAPLMNLVFDLQGSYRTVLLAAALLMIGVTLAIQWVIGTARKEKENA